MCPRARRDCYKVRRRVPDGGGTFADQRTVRLTVQFQSVLETFTPHDTVFSFSVASEVTEAALGLCTMLLPSAASLKSSNSSLRRRRLDEITEDVEEGTATPEPEPEIEPGPGSGLVGIEQTKMASPESSERPSQKSEGHQLRELPASALLAKALLAKRKEDAAAEQGEGLRPPRKDSLLPRNAASPLLTFNKSLPATPESTPPNTSEGDAPRNKGGQSIIAEEAEDGPLDAVAPRPAPSHHLSPVDSDSISQWSSNVASYATVKPKKKKLGPRPHVESSSRPKTSGTSDGTLRARPIANLPTSIRVSNRSLINISLRPGSQQSTRSVPIRFAPSSQSTVRPPLPSPSHVASFYRGPESRPTASRPPSVATEVPSATPEKMRLMKALQLRKRNMLLAQRASTAVPPPASAHTYSASVSSTGSQVSATQLSSAASTESDGHEQLTNIDEECKSGLASTVTSPTSLTNVSEEPSTKASSFTEHDDQSQKRQSLSSDTSSSVTPKAAPHSEKTKGVSRASARTTLTQSAHGLLARSAPDAHDDSIAGDAHEEGEVSATGSALGEASPQPSSEDGPSSDERLGEAVSPGDHEQRGRTTTPPPAPPAEAPIAPAPLVPVSPAQSEVVDRPNKRQGPPPFLPVTSSAEVSEASEDESLMDELQHATVHEAKPVSVARSPITPVMAKGSSDRLKDLVAKASGHQSQSVASTPGSRARSVSRPGSVRSVSTALPQWPPVVAETTTAPLSKKSTLGSGISKRIKALEVLSNKNSTSPPHPSSGRDTSTPRSAFSTFVKRSSLMLHQQPTNASSDVSPPARLPSAGHHPREYDAVMHSPQATRQLQDSSTELHAPVQKGETISVTARIVRDPSAITASSPTSSDFGPLSLYRSPLIVEHEKREDGPSRLNVGKEGPFGSISSSTKSPTKSSDKTRFSFSSRRSESQSRVPRSESSASKMSHGSGHKKHLSSSVSDAGSITEEKSKGSRTSRLMKRMSSLTSGSPWGLKTAVLSPSKEQVHPHRIEEQNESSSRNSSIEAPLLHVVDIGDVNVQFPESLLWKRRFMRIDDQGYLIFSPPTTDAGAKNNNRKYHLNDFKPPTLPDMEREEMAWSILLDLKDGRCIQCACENKYAQQQVLQSEQALNRGLLPRPN